MWDVFLSQPQIRAPDVNLGVGSGTHAKQTAEIMIWLEPVILEFKPDVVFIYGDVNSTIAAAFSVVFPVHPRTRQRISEFKLNSGKLHLLEPLPYIEFLAMQSRAAVVITDSGGIQEETTYLGVPCLTLRNNTERPITVTLGTNVIVGQDREKLSAELLRIVEKIQERDNSASVGRPRGRADRRCARISTLAVRPIATFAVVQLTCFLEPPVQS